MIWFRPSKEFSYLFGVVENAITLIQFCKSGSGVFAVRRMRGKPFPEDAIRRVQSAYYAKFDCGKCRHFVEGESGVPRFITGWTVRDRAAILDTKIWCIYNVRIDGIDLCFNESDTPPCRIDKLCANEHAMLYGF